MGATAMTEDFHLLGEGNNEMNPPPFPRKCRNFAELIRYLPPPSPTSCD
jgi:hypothetical protein